jgi:bacterioferritin-associated ferredoxin
MSDESIANHSHYYYTSLRNTLQREIGLMYVCVCNAVTDRQIREAAGQGIRSMEALCDRLKVASCCGRCSDCARKVLAGAVSDRRSPKPAGALVT